jgi:hypothetical protein
MSLFWRAFLLGAMSGLMGHHLAGYAAWRMLDRQLASGPRRRRSGSRCPTCGRHSEPEP